MIEELQEFLEDAGVTTPIVLGTMPESPDVVVVLYETAGLAPEHGYGAAGIQFENPGLQVVVRGEAYDYAAPRAIAETIYQALATIQGQELGETDYLMVRPQQSPFQFKVDENGRKWIACNFLVEKRPS